MPRNLTDLMEAAVSTAPPEPHHASDITRLAERQPATPYDGHRRPRGPRRGGRRRPRLRPYP